MIVYILSALLHHTSMHVQFGRPLGALNIFFFCVNYMNGYNLYTHSASSDYVYLG